MGGTFDSASLERLRAIQEVGIWTSKSRRRPVIIWVVAVGDAVFVRSVRGPKGQWHATVQADGSAALELDGRKLPVRAVPVTDTATIDAVSQEYLRKYATSPYAKSMVAADTLPTTLRLDPR